MKLEVKSIPLFTLSTLLVSINVFAENRLREDLAFAIKTHKAEEVRKIIPKLDKNFSFKLFYPYGMGWPYVIRDSVFTLATRLGDPAILVAVMDATHSNGDSYPDEEGLTPLMIAAKEGHKGKVGILIRAGADLNFTTKDGRTPYSVARTQEIKDLLLLSGAEDTPDLIQAVTSKNMAEFHRITSKFGRRLDLFFRTLPVPNRDNLLTLAVRVGNLEAVKEIVKAYRGDGREANLHTNGEKASPLQIAFENGHIEVAQFLLNSGASLSTKRDGKTLFYTALEKGNEAMAQLILQSGKLNIRKEIALATQLGNVGVLEFLIKAGVKVDGPSPLWMATLRGRADEVQSLLDAGGDLSTKWNERTPFFIAVERGHQDIARRMIESGKLNIKNEILLAFQLGKKDVAKEIERMFQSENLHCDVSEEAMKEVLANGGIGSEIHTLARMGFDLACPICLNPMGVREKGESSARDVSIVQCGHTFCKTCLSKWQTTSQANTCPMCRHDFTGEQIYSFKPEKSATSIEVNKGAKSIRTSVAGTGDSVMANDSIAAAAQRAN